MQMLGPQKAALYISDDEMVSKMASHFEVPSSILTTKQEREAVIQQLSQAAGQAESMNPGQGGAQVLDIASRMTGSGN